MSYEVCHTNSEGSNGLDPKVDLLIILQQYKIPSKKIMEIVYLDIYL